MRTLFTAAGVALVIAVGASDSTQRSEAVFSVDRDQAKQVAVVVDFVHAWNARQLSKALALLAPNASMSDCEYRTHRAVVLTGNVQIAAWLRKRFADHDVLTIGRIWNENPDDDRVAGIDWARRKSLLFPRGIVPKLSTKVVFSSNGRIRGFASGPGGAPIDEQARICTP